MKKKINWGYLWLLPFAIIIVVCILALTGVIVGGVSNSRWTNWLSKDLSTLDNFTLNITTTDGISTSVKVDKDKQIMLIERQHMVQSESTSQAGALTTVMQTECEYYGNTLYRLQHAKVTLVENTFVSFTTSYKTFEDMEQDFANATALWELLKPLASSDVKNEFAFSPSTDVYSATVNGALFSIKFISQGVQASIKYEDGSILSIELKDVNNTQIVVPYQISYIFV